MEQLNELMDDVKITPEEEKKREALRRMGVLEGWFWPSFIYSVDPTSFKQGICAYLSECPILLDNYRHLPFPEHLISKRSFDEEEQKAILRRDNMIERTAMTNMARWPLFADMELITPTLLMLLTGKPTGRRKLHFQELQRALLDDYARDKREYEEAWTAFKELEATMPEEARAECLQKLDGNGVFFRSKKAQHIVRQFLTVARACYLKERMSDSEYQGYTAHPPTQPVRRTVIYYSRIRDMLEIYQGFFDTKNDHLRYQEFQRRCQEANREFSMAPDVLLAQVLRNYPELNLALDEIYAYFDKGYMSPNWNNEVIHSCLINGVLVKAMREYTVGMIAALERCILTMIGMEEELIPHFLITKLPTDLKLHDFDSHTEEIVKSNSHLYHVRYNFLGNVWRPICPLRTAVLQEKDPRRAIQEQRSILLALANDDRPRSLTNDRYLTAAQLMAKRVPRTLFSESRYPFKIYLGTSGETLRVFN